MYQDTKNFEISDAVRKFLQKLHMHHINGDWTSGASDETIAVFDPATGLKISEVISGTSEDVDRAVKAARQAFESGPWAQMNGYERGRLIQKLSDRLAECAEEFAELEALDAGKPIVYARAADIPTTVRVYSYHAGAASKISGETLTPTMPGDFHAYTLREPVGVVGVITPWNFPLLLTAMKLAPLLACGCTAVIKPSEVTPLSMLRLMDLIQEVGFPPGVVNVVTGYGDPVGSRIAAHEGIDKVSFTGSGATGRKVLAAAGGNLKRVTLELGGKSPMIVFPDADIDKAIPGLASAILFHQGQVCTAGSRLFVPKSLHDRVVEGIADMAKNISLGHSLDSKTNMGPMASQNQLDRVQRYLEQGKNEGADCVIGGTRPEGNGYFLTPTILTNTRPEMSVVKEEIFGPVLCVQSYSDDDRNDAIRLANDTVFGLAASVWTKDLSTAHKAAKKLRAGNVWINTHNIFDPALPFGGFKQSGWGREQGSEVIRSYTEVKTVCAAL
ncbi:aldehyde dehydrogenase family protein [Pseudotabrizicola sp. 4114]|uniref:aldehyde dehydrogenase family protein n=1 Tax=Pseudotabrizicola sp. 4114 TaxID=2817731 RepID=UPI00285A4BC8|nr:phenylacetaldehyde dehydrogenase [Pseudorhodobacter sp. 4114]